jgi:hypothetical protein
LVNFTFTAIAHRTCRIVSTAAINSASRFPLAASASFTCTSRKRVLRVFVIGFNNPSGSDRSSGIGHAYFFALPRRGVAASLFKPYFFMTPTISFSSGDRGG